MHKTLFSLVLVSFLSSAGLLSADEIQFPKTKYVTHVDGKDKELNANLIFSDGLIVVKPGRETLSLLRFPMVK